MTIYQILLALIGLNGTVFGLLFAVAPDAAIGLFGGRLDTLGSLLVRQLGGVILGLAAINWLLRQVELRQVRKAVVVGDVTAFVVIALVAAIAAASGVINLLGWVVAGFHAVVAIGLVADQLRSGGRSGGDDVHDVEAEGQP